MSLEGTDLVTVAVLVGFLAFLLYRVLRRERLTKVARFGFFVERSRFDDEEEPDTKIITWPNRTEDP